MPRAQLVWGARAQEEGGSQHKLLEEEPLLAARLVIENSMCLLLDVDDIDRLCALSYSGRENDEHSLRQVRLFPAATQPQISFHAAIAITQGLRVLIAASLGTLAFLLCVPQAHSLFIIMSTLPPLLPKSAASLVHTRSQACARSTQAYMGVGTSTRGHSLSLASS